jgi:hypothetical protein
LESVPLASGIARLGAVRSVECSRGERRLEERSPVAFVLPFKPAAVVEEFFTEYQSLVS